MQENVIIIMAEKKHEQRAMDNIKYDAMNSLDTQINKAENNVGNCEQPISK